MKEIRISNFSLYIKVDDEDYDRTILHTWTLNDSNGVYTWIGSNNLSIGQFILGQSILEVDHKDRDRLNNQKENLRYANKTQQQGNKGIQINNTSGYKGVVWDKSRNKWKAQIKRQGSMIFIGRYNSAIEAAKAYNETAKAYFGEFAYLNNLD